MTYEIFTMNSDGSVVTRLTTNDAELVAGRQSDRVPRKPARLVILDA